MEINYISQKKAKFKTPKLEITTNNENLPLDRNLRNQYLKNNLKFSAEDFNGKTENNFNSKKKDELKTLFCLPKKVPYKTLQEINAKFKSEILTKENYYLEKNLEYEKCVKCANVLRQNGEISEFDNVNFVASTIDNGKIILSSQFIFLINNNNGPFSIFKKFEIILISEIWHESSSGLIYLNEPDLEISLLENNKSKTEYFIGFLLVKHLQLVQEKRRLNNSNCTEKRHYFNKNVKVETKRLIRDVNSNSNDDEFLSVINKSITELPSCQKIKNYLRSIEEEKTVFHRICLIGNFGNNFEKENDDNLNMTDESDLEDMIEEKMGSSFFKPAHIIISKNSLFLFYYQNKDLAFESPLINIVVSKGSVYCLIESIGIEASESNIIDNIKWVIKFSNDEDLKCFLEETSLALN